MTSLLFNPAKCAFSRGFMTPMSMSMSMRCVSTLKENPAIYCFKDREAQNTHILTLLPTDPPTRDLAIGIATHIPPTPDTFRENPRFLEIMNDVLKKNAAQDPRVLAEASTMAAQGGLNFKSGGMSTPGRTTRATTKKGKEDVSGGASAQGGTGGGGSGGSGGFIHVTDERCPPAFGRIAWPENIFGSLQVSADGRIDGDGGYQPSGAYRVVTNDGILGLTPYLREKLTERLREEEAKLRKD